MTTMISKLLVSHLFSYKERWKQIFLWMKTGKFQFLPTLNNVQLPYLPVPARNRIAQEPKSKILHLKIDCFEKSFTSLSRRTFRRQKTFVIIDCVTVILVQCGVCRSSVFRPEGTKTFGNPGKEPFSLLLKWRNWWKMKQPHFRLDDNSVIKLFLRQWCFGAMSPSACLVQKFRLIILVKARNLFTVNSLTKKKMFYNEMSIEKYS